MNNELNNLDRTKNSWSICEACLGRGKKSRRLSKKARLNYQLVYDQYVISNRVGDAPPRPKASLYTCPSCGGNGILASSLPPAVDNIKFPHIAIIGAGIGGVALAVACLHRGIPFTLFERDRDFNVRSQGYGLTLQQANRAIKRLGIENLEDGIISTRHLVHNSEGKILGEWGVRKWIKNDLINDQRRSNVHISRQALRQDLLSQLEKYKSVQWGYQLIDFNVSEQGGLHLNFLVDGEKKTATADLLVGADGIRSSVRRLLLGDEIKPLRYLNCIVILGICFLENLNDLESSLLDGATVFQTANGNDRIYVMPYSADAVMWQLSFPMTESEAKELSLRGSIALKDEAVRRMDWHEPIPQIIAATESSYISGYPVYDREMLDSKLGDKDLNVTLIGDAAHPMSPFKGQGANQALLDAIALAQSIYTTYQYEGWNKIGLREEVLTSFEREMLTRSSVKVKDSADAVQVLHSEMVFEGGDQPRGLRKDKV